MSTSSRIYKIISSAALAVVLAGCAQQQTPQAAPTVTVTAPAPTVTVTVTATPEPTAKVVADAEYDSVAKLREAYEAAGYECDDWEQTDKVEFAAESGECDTDTVLSVYDDKDDVKSQVQGWKDFYKEMGSDREAYLVVGPNWIVNTADHRMAGVQMVLGGEIVSNQS